jgi:hypothetical protein
MRPLADSAINMGCMVATKTKILSAATKALNDAANIAAATAATKGLR